MARKKDVGPWITEEGLAKITAWARDGLTEEQIAHNMSIGRTTLGVWKNEHADILAALKNGKEVADIAVENALYKRATGYTYTEVTSERVCNPDTYEYELVVTKEVVKELPPDTTAQIYWLKNRKPAVWRDRQELSISDSAIDVNIKVVE